MPDNPIPLMLLLTAFGFLIGAAVGYFAYKFEGRKVVSKPDEQQQPDPRTKYLTEQVGLWRDRATSRLVIWFEGKPLNSAQSLDEAHRQQLVRAGQEFLAWLGVKAAAVEPALKPSGEEPSENPALPPDVPLTLVDAPPVLPVASGAAAASAGPAKPLTIVEQIDEILQDLLKNDPGLSARAIRLLEDPREGAVVWVGIEHFNGVDTVPYPEVKAVLRQAAAEWERRTERSRR